MTANQRKSFGLYIAAAGVFALGMFLINLIPGIEGGGRAIQYRSFGPLCATFIFCCLVEPFDAVLNSFHLPGWSGYGALIALIGIGILYSLLVVLPLYSYLRTRRSWFLAVQALALAAHAGFSLCVVAPFWISQ